ncbi:vacuolar iron transporter homolog 4-like [Macadamia integrifolia]|uniref:vacuolar iron transporter homolog 4-like n=1 Tax=Macadamia integrifolia TaxID=60698 RepID=UPI001C4FC63F|nr:vacuolar iron transporter homolog 4-like [Macadamia integrifolia]
MEGTTEAGNQTSVKENTNPVIPINKHNDLEGQIGQEPKEDEIDYFQRAQWLRAAVLGASDGLVSTASLMMGVGAVRQDVKSMIISGFAGMVAGACSMAIGEFVSVYSQRDIEVSQMKRESEIRIKNEGELCNEDDSRKEKLPNPFQAAAVSALAFTIGAAVPLLSASFIQVYGVRLAVVIALSSLALVVFGWVGAFLGKAPVKRSCFRVLVGGWFAMAITYGLSRLIGIAGL